MKQLISRLLAITVLLSPLYSMASVVYWSGGYDEGPCRLGDKCDCVAIDVMSLNKKNYCVSFDHNKPLMSVPSGSTCPDEYHANSDPITQRAAVAWYYDVDISRVLPRLKQQCFQICDIDGANCRIRAS